MGRFGRSLRQRRAAGRIRQRVAELTQTDESSAGLVKVCLYFVELGEDQPNISILAEADLYKFLTASLELHFEPGKEGACHVQFITVEVLRPQGPYWWSTPGLKANDDPSGAVIFNWDACPTLLWHREGAALPRWASAD